MFKNKIAGKLFLYFTLTLLLFAFVVGMVFTVLFKEHTLELHKKDMLSRASSISKTLSSYTPGKSGMMGGYGSYMRFIGDIAGGDVWIVDEQLNLITGGMHGMAQHGGYVYSDLPKNAETIIQEVFSDKIVFSQDFSPLLSETTLTLGVPIKDSVGRIFGVVLIHSPVKGTDSAIIQGMRLLSISIIIALALSFLLSIWLSKKFTEPIISKEAQDALRLESVRREFVANVSHELRTPVTVLRGSIEALSEGVVTEKGKVGEYYSQMLVEVKYLQRLVGDLLDLSRLQNADFEIDKSKLNFFDVLEDAVRSITSVAAEKNIKINLIANNHILEIFGDYGRLRQMLIIIIDNAIKFSDNDSSVDIVLEGGTLSITDYGIGIDQQELPYIFDRFHKSRSEQNKQGTGLGLAIAKQIADRHNINITIKSEKQKGTRFTLIFNNIIAPVTQMGN